MSGETRHHPDCTCDKCGLERFKKMRAALRRISVAASQYSMAAKCHGHAYSESGFREIENQAVEALK